MGPDVQVFTTLHVFYRRLFTDLRVPKDHMGFAGTENGSFFHPPAWVDPEKPAGYSKQPVTTAKSSVLNIASTNFFFNSPNFVWFSIVVLVYFAFPYDLEAAKTWKFDWILHRGLVNLGVTLTYYSFWEVTLYHLGVYMSVVLECVP